MKITQKNTTITSELFRYELDCIKSAKQRLIEIVNNI